MIREGENLVLIEVKQAGLRRGTKTWGNITDVAQDLITTLGKAVRQLYLFEEDVLSGRFSALSMFSGVKAIERLVVTHDHLHFNNWILQEQIREGLRQNSGLTLPHDYTFHVASIEDFEYIVASYGTSLFDFLHTKSQNADFKEFDFTEYLAHSNVVVRENAYLEAVYDDYMAELKTLSSRNQ